MWLFFCTREIPQKTSVQISSSMSMACLFSCCETVSFCSSLSSWLTTCSFMVMCLQAYHLLSIFVLTSSDWGACLLDWANCNSDLRSMWAMFELRGQEILRGAMLERIDSFQHASCISLQPGWRRAHLVVGQEEVQNRSTYLYSSKFLTIFNA